MLDPSQHPRSWSETTISLEPRSSIDPSDIRSLGRVLGLREAVTPDTGNCMAMAVAQAFADADLTGGSTDLERMTASIKRGIALAGLLHLEDSYCHDVRVQTLHNVERDWSHMTRKESANQFRWYLFYYSHIPSDRTSTIGVPNRGGSNTFGMTSMFLQRAIFLCWRYGWARSRLPEV